MPTRFIRNSPSMLLGIQLLEFLKEMEIAAVLTVSVNHTTVVVRTNEGKDIASVEFVQGVKTYDKAVLRNHADMPGMDTKIEFATREFNRIFGILTAAVGMYTLNLEKSKC